MLLDFSRPPTPKERQSLAGRVKRMEASDFTGHIRKITDRLMESGPHGSRFRKDGLLIRSGFSCQQSGVAGDWSDRKAPPREFRPPATRISSSKGATLRLQLTIMSLLQICRKPGAAAHLNELGIPIAGNSGTVGWADFVPAFPRDSHSGGTLITSRDKRARIVRSALASLAEAGLVSLPKPANALNRFEGFVPLIEIGKLANGETEEYTVPKKGVSSFSIPANFVLQNWLQLLEDSEIAVLLMAACQKWAWAENGLWAFPGDVRLRHYGIHRDPYSRALKTLQWMGLINVHEVDRHGDGRAEGGATRLHRIGIVPEGFDESAVTKIPEVFRYQLNRP
jgi:hypothetical protein